MSDLKFDPNNARHHPQKNKDLIRRSLEESGGGRSILVDGDNIIRAGNGVYEQALNLGMNVRVVEAAPDEIIAVKRPDLKGRAAERAALMDNRTAETSEWDLDVLYDTEGDMLDGMFSEKELNEMFAGKLRLDEKTFEPEEKSPREGSAMRMINLFFYEDEYALFCERIKEIANKDETLTATVKRIVMNS